MKLIENAILRFKEGNSDKAYEVELLEVSNDKYLVNFSFGKYGSVLKPGTKTENPVSLQEAKKIFDELVLSKTKKGYIASNNNSETKVLTKPYFEYDREKQKDEILSKLSISQDKTGKILSIKKLFNKKEKEYKKDKSLGRIIWRAGELKIKEALAYLLELLDTEDLMEKYSVIWSIGNCGDESVSSTLKDIFQNENNPEMIKRIAEEAFLKIASENEKNELINNKIEQLPNHLKDLVKNENWTDFNQAFNLYISKSDNIKHLETIYFINNDNIRNTFLFLIKTLPLKAPNFKVIRHIFKSAEYRLDAEVYGIISKRFEKEKSLINNKGYNWNSSWGHIQINGDYINSSQIKDELKTNNSRFAYTKTTKEYMIRRVSRILRKLGRDQNPKFVKMAVGILLAYSDSDAVPSEKTTKSIYNYKTRRYKNTESYWDKYAPYLTLNYLLYSNSPRYTHDENSIAWKCKNNYVPGDKEPDVREEVYPEMWNQVPAGLIHLLAESNCEPVQNFAVKAIKELKDIWSDLDTETLLLFINKPYENTVNFGFERLKERFNPQNPDLEIIKSLMLCVSSKARNQSFEWINSNKDFYFKNPDFVFSLMVSEYSDVREFIKNSNIRFSNEDNKIIVAKLISYLLLKVKEFYKAQDISQNLKTNYKSYMKELGIDIIKDLLNSSIEPIQELGAYVVENHNIKIENMPYEILQNMINSEFESVRSVGVNLIAQLPDQTAILRIPLIISLATHRLIDIRMETRTLIEKLIINQSHVGDKITEELIKSLINKESNEGVHADTLFLLENQLNSFLNNLTLEQILIMIKSKTPEAQELGGNLLSKPQNIYKAQDLPILEIVKLSNHEILSVRNASWQILMSISKEIISDKKKLSKVMRFFDSKKEDSRQFARNTFIRDFSDSDWTPELLIGLCDSIFPDVRQFGVNMLKRMFSSEHAIEYLTKLSESPSPDIQFFATGYLNEYVNGDIEKIKELVPYFKRVLSHVNRSRIAKNRILTFLSEQSKINNEIAKIVAEIISWYSATNSVGDKSKAINLMIEIANDNPDLDLPIKFNNQEVRNVI